MYAERVEVHRFFIGFFVIPIVIPIEAVILCTTAVYFHRLYGREHSCKRKIHNLYPLPSCCCRFDSGRSLLFSVRIYAKSEIPKI